MTKLQVSLNFRFSRRWALTLVSNGQLGMEATLQCYAAPRQFHPLLIKLHSFELPDISIFSLQNVTFLQKWERGKLGNHSGGNPCRIFGCARNLLLLLRQSPEWRSLTRDPFLCFFFGGNLGQFWCKSIPTKHWRDSIAQRRAYLPPDPAALGLIPSITVTCSSLIIDLQLLSGLRNSHSGQLSQLSLALTKSDCYSFALSNSSAKWSLQDQYQVPFELYCIRSLAGGTLRRFSEVHQKILRNFLATWGSCSPPPPLKNGNESTSVVFFYICYLKKLSPRRP